MYLLVFLSILYTHICFYILSATKPKFVQLLAGLGFSFAISAPLFAHFEYAITIINIVTLTFIGYMRNKNIILNLSMALMASVVALVADYFLGNIIVLITNCQIEELLYGDGFGNAYLYTLGDIFVGAILSAIVGYIINKKIGIKEMMFTGKIGAMTLFLMVFSALFFYASTAFCKSLGFNNSFIRSMGLMIGAYFLVTITISFQMIKNMAMEVDYRNQVEQNQNLNMYVVELERVYKELRGFKHDYKNILASLYMFILTNNMDGLKNYFENDIMKVDKINEHESIEIGFLQKLKDRQLSGVIVTKILKAKELKVDFKVDIPDDIGKINMDNIDTIRILGILIDNAIEENIGVENGYVRLGIIDEDGIVVITVTNSVKEKIKNINAIFVGGYSTKKGNTGLGLYNVKKLISVYDNVKFRVMSDNSEFVVELEIK